MSSNEAETPPLLTIACYIPLKKKKKFDLLKLAEACRSRRVKLIPIDLDNGTFAGDVDPVTIDILLHKLTDVLSRKKDGDGNALSIAASLERFVSSNPAMIVLDPIGNVEHLLDRCTQYEMLAARYPLQHVAVTGVCFPPYAKITTADDSATCSEKLLAAGVKFPLICKPLSAHGYDAHRMNIVFGKEGLSRMKRPFIAHKFVNHGGRIYKIFAIGANKIFVFERDSFPDLAGTRFRGDDVIQFDSSDLKTATILPQNQPLFDKDSEPTTLPPAVSTTNGHRAPTSPRQECVDALVSDISRLFGLTLFGVDVIIEAGTGVCAIVDVNIFPSYGGVEDLYGELADYLLSFSSKNR